jgi:signal transduction histidine kinase
LREEAPGIPVLILTGNEDEQLGVQAVREGAQDFLTKRHLLPALLGRAIRYAIERVRVGAELDSRARELAKNENRLRSIIEANGDAAIVVDRNGIVQFVNTAATALFAQDASSQLSRPFPYPIVPGAASEIDIVRDGRTAGVAEMRVVPLDWAGEPGHLVILRDITRIRKAQEMQLRSQKLAALGTLASGIAHDLNNILQTINSNVQLMTATLPPGHVFQENFRSILEASDRASDLASRVLKFSKPSAPRKEYLRVDSVIAEAARFLRASLPAMIEMHTHIEPNCPDVLANASEIHQVIMNLGANASHALTGRSHGTLQIDLETVDVTSETVAMLGDIREGRYVRLSVSDNGCGIPRDVLPRIFEPYFSTRPVGVGTGLGLAIVQGIVQAHNGTVTVYSHPDEGTVFRVYLPVVSTRMLTENAAPEPVSQSASIRGGGEKILYIDDEPQILTLNSKYLTDLGYEVKGFSDPAAAMRFFRQNPQSFDAVVMDLAMPRISGLDVAHEMLRVYPELNIILTSGYFSPSDSERAQAIGVKHLLVKPNILRQLGGLLAKMFVRSEDHEVR